MVHALSVWNFCTLHNYVTTSDCMITLQVWASVVYSELSRSHMGHTVCSPEATELARRRPTLLLPAMSEPNWTIVATVVGTCN